MDFRKVNPLNERVNFMSGNMLPVTPENTKVLTGRMIYAAFSWIILLMYTVSSFLGLFKVNADKALRDGTMNAIVCFEVIVLTAHMHNRRDSLRSLIEKSNILLECNDEKLKKAINETILPLDKPLKIYVASAIGTVFNWIVIPLFMVFTRKEFFISDLSVPIFFVPEPLSCLTFVLGLLFELIGSTYAIFKKVSLDIYMTYLVLLLTAQYEYLRVKFTDIVRRRICEENAPSLENLEERRNRETRVWISQHSIVVQISVLMKDILSFCVGLLYVNLIFRFCFVGFMVITTPSLHFDKVLIIMYGVGLLLQVYMICFCMQQLLETSTDLTSNAFHEEWFNFDVKWQKIFKIIMDANKMGTRISSVKKVDLTIPSFATILNHAYSVCIFILRVK